MGLIAWYPLNGDTLDYSGNGRHATITGTIANLMVSNEGKIGKTYKTSGVNSGGYMVSGSSVNLGQKQSMFAWVNIATLCTSSSLTGLVDQHRVRGNTANNPASGMGITARYLSSTDWRVSCSTANIAGGRTYNTYTGTTILKTNTWYHVGYTYNGGTGNLKFYVNGKLDNEYNLSFTMNIVSDSFRIFGWNGTSSYQGEQRINDVRIYDHTLSEKEVKEISKAKILHYKFDDFQEPTENIWRGNLTIYNNYSVPASLVATGELLFGQPVYRLTMTATSGSISSFKSSLYSQGVYGSSITYKGGVKYSASIYWKPVNRSDTEVGGTASNIGGFSSTPIERFPGGWNRYTQVRRGGEVNNKTGHVFFSFRSPSMSIGDVIQIDFCCPQIEEGRDYATPFTSNSRSGIIRDCSGYGNDATLDLDTTPTWTSDSKIGGGAYEFNGSDTISTDRLFYDDINQAHTVSAWVYLTDQTISNQQLINFHNGYCLIYSTSNNRSLMYMNSGVNDHYVYGSPIPINEWTLVTWVYDKENLRCQVYYNGVLDASSGNFTSSDEARGFSTTTIFGNNFKGKIDDVRIYATALSAEDVKELYAQRASIDNEGRLHLELFNETEFNPLLYDYTIWQNGQTGSIGLFTQYGSSNSRVLGIDPWGKETVVWRNSVNGGLYNSAVPIDNTKTYRMSWWERRVNNVGTSLHYAGLNGYGSVNGVGNLGSGTANTNPYFWYGNQGQFTSDDWILIVGHVHPHDYTGTTSLESGRYNLSGKYAGINTDYKWLPQTTSARPRTLSLYQGSNSTQEHYTVYPRMEICDGTEPSITELLHGFDSRYIDYIRSKSNTKMLGLDIGDSITHIGKLHEVGMKIRYIRDTVSGSTANSSNHWVEIQAYDINEVNIALGKSASSSLLTDGSTSSSPYYSGGPATVDLGSVEIVNYLKIWHYWADGRTYHDIKTEVSVDNVNWITVFDSNIDGEYKETSSGKTIILRPNKLSIDSKGNLFINEISEV